jgi:hypothetical protein
MSMRIQLGYNRRSLLSVAVGAVFLSVVPLSSAFAAQAGSKTADQLEEKARQDWRDSMHQINPPAAGCFHASYPSTDWEKVACEAAPAYRSAISRRSGHEQKIGNGSDFVALVPPGNLLTSVTGSFPSVVGVESEKSVGVALFGGGGILGPNEYTLQVNTNFYNSAACDGFAYCLAWQQYVMSTNTPVSLTKNKLTGKTEVFIEYWLINYGVDDGSNICPKGFLDAGPDYVGPGDDCVQNTPAVAIYNGQLPITKLQKLQLTASAKPDGTDKATVTYEGEAYTATVKDNLTDISHGWTEAEFNVVGNAGGSKAVFNSGSAIAVKVALDYGSNKTPTCLSPAEIQGTTGETNNLKPGSCSESGGKNPSIEFTESN